MIRETVTADDIQTYAADPFAFFADAIIPTAGGDVPLSKSWAEFQREAFRVLADCVKAIAIGQKPPYRGLWLERTKGGSKDSDVGLGLLWLLMFATRPQVIELGADDLDQILETYKAMVAVIRCNPWMNERLTVLRNRIACQATGSECLFLTRDASGSHGSRPTATVCNELSHCNDGDFIATMLDNADKIANNLAIICTNAGHRNTWQYRWRETYRTDPDWFFQKIDYPAPWIDPKKVADAERRNPPSRFLRLWKGVWASGTGDALEATDIEASVTLPGPAYTAEPGISYLAGLDLGVKRDHSALCVVGCDHATSKVKLASVESWKPLPGGAVNLEQVRQGVLSAFRRFGITGVFYDPWQCEYMAQTLRNDGVVMEAVPFTGAALTKMASVLLETFRSHRIELYRDPELLADLERLSIVERSYGYRLESTRDSNGHADRATALAIVLPTATELSAVQISTYQEDKMGNNIFGPGGWRW